MTDIPLSLPVLCSRCASERAHFEAQGWTFVSCNKAADQSGSPPGESKCVLKMKKASSA